MGDISFAYLNSWTKELLYTRAGPEFGPELEGKILIIQKALYGAKGSASAWYLRFADHARGHGFRICKTDKSVWYLYDEKTDLYTYLASHVDDYYLTGPLAIKADSDIKKVWTTGKIDPEIPSLYIGINMSPCLLYTSPSPRDS